MSRRVILALLVCLLLSASEPAICPAAGWKTCNDTPVKVEDYPTPMLQEQYSIPPGSRAERVYIHAMLDHRTYGGALSFGGLYTYIRNGVNTIVHGDGKSQVALVPAANIDGNPGLTIEQTDGCVFSWEEEHIEEADVMVASELSFADPDESKVITGSAMGQPMGPIVLLHEMGHALGLEHTSAFGVMRNGMPAGVPFVGATKSSGGNHSDLVGDDVYGTHRVYGVAPLHHDLFASSQLLKGGAIINTSCDPTSGDKDQTTVLSLCPDQTINMYVSVGNVGTSAETVAVRVYAGDGDADYFGHTLVTFPTVRIEAYGARAFPVQLKVPASLPRGKTLTVYTEVDSGGAVNERREYNNYARSALRFRVKTVAECGK